MRPLYKASQCDERSVGINRREQSGCQAARSRRRRHRGGGKWGGGALPSPLLAVPNVTAHAHQRPVYQLQLFNVALLITFAL